MSGPPIDELVGEARLVRERAYAPYSGFRVGAALWAEGRVFTGVNVENASYPLSLCAERNAAARAISEGATTFEAIAVVTDADAVTPPCGGCRQVLHEFGPGMTVVSESADGAVRTTWTLPELLPDAFGPRDLLQT